jgi:hypothetical protein
MKQALFLWFRSWLIVLALVILLDALCMPLSAQSVWTTPVPLNPYSGQQAVPYIATSNSGFIAVTCFEWQGERVAVYWSSDRGTTFSRFLLPLPSGGPEQRVYGPADISFDQQENLYVLWKWAETNGPYTLAEWIVLSKTTNQGMSFSTVWQKRQQAILGPVPEILQIDTQNTIHVVWDSTTMSLPEAFRLRYTRFVNGNPNNRVDLTLPRPQDTLREGRADLLIVGDTLHYAVIVDHYLGGGQSIRLPFYAKSTDMGSTFADIQQLDTALSIGNLVIKKTTTGNAIAYSVAKDEYTLALTARTFVGSAFSLPIRLGSKPLPRSFSSRTNLVLSQGKNCLLYDGFDTIDNIVVGSYYEYEDIAANPIDSSFFPLFQMFKLAVDSLGGKHAVGIRQQEFRIYYTRKDVVSGVNDGIRTPNENLVEVTATADNGQHSVLLRVYLGRPTQGTLKLFDLLGREVLLIYIGSLDGGNHSFTASTDDLASGVYFVSFQSSLGDIVRKLVITR